METTTFPIIVKLGHIQQSIGLRIFKRKEETLQGIDEIYRWIEEGFVDRFDDGTRKWAIDANVLCVLI